MAVQAFLEGAIAFTDIAGTIEATLEDGVRGEPESLDEVLALDREAREIAGDETRRRGSRRPGVGQR